MMSNAAHCSLVGKVGVTGIYVQNYKKQFSIIELGRFWYVCLAVFCQFKG
jgi:hypothetical protein